MGARMNIMNAVRNKALQQYDKSMLSKLGKSNLSLVALGRTVK